VDVPRSDEGLLPLLLLLLVIVVVLRWWSLPRQEAPKKINTKKRLKR
jgi:hypothetical protein